MALITRDVPSEVPASIYVRIFGFGMLGGNLLWPNCPTTFVLVEPVRRRELPRPWGGGRGGGYHSGLVLMAGGLG